MKTMKLNKFIIIALTVFCMCFSLDSTHAQSGSIELETTTSSPAAKTIYGNSMPLAYGVIASDGTIISGYGIDSSVICYPGCYRIKLSQGFAGQTANMVTRRLPFPTQVNLNITTSSSPGNRSVNIYFGDNDGNGASETFSFVIFGTPLNYGSGCPVVMSGNGVGQAPNEFLRFSFDDATNCMNAIPFTITNPNSDIEVVVGNFANPPATDPVEVTVNYDLGSGTTSQSINLTNAGAALNLGEYVSPMNNVPYDLNIIFTYDGTQFVTAQVVATPL